LPGKYQSIVVVFVSESRAILPIRYRPIAMQMFQRVANQPSILYGQFYDHVNSFVEVFSLDLCIYHFL
jgi:hypothetical protein